MKAIIGLGNPGAQYKHTLHNAGVWFVERAQEDFSGSAWQQKPNLFARESCVRINEQQVRIFIPTTFMNESGRAIAAIMKFYKLTPEQMLVVHDELDFPLGQSRFKAQGGHGGHNGLCDIISAIGSSDFLRLRLGVGRPSSAQQEVDSYLLSPASSEKIQRIQESIQQSCKVLPTILEHGLEKAICQLHGEDYGV